MLPPRAVFGRVRAAIVIVPIALLGCRGPSNVRDESPREAPPPAATAAPGVIEATPAPEKPLAPLACTDPLPIFEDGRPVGRVCEADAAARGLTVVDLSDQWAPRPFAMAGDRAPPYRAELLALADERFGSGPEWDRAREDRFLELYGIFPNLRVMRARILDDARHRCHDAIDDAPLEKLTRTVDPWTDRDRMRGEVGYAEGLRRTLEFERKRRKLASFDELEKEKGFDYPVGKWRKASEGPRAISAVQAHLRCEKLLGPKSQEGVLDHAGTEALRAFQRKQMIVSFSLDAETKHALAADSREEDLRGLLRVLRERVADAQGLIEDGSARGERGLVAGRGLDSAALSRPQPGASIDLAAPDLISAAADAAAKALGWTTPAGARAFLEPLGESGTKTLKVALKLPPPPAYHAKHMEIRAVIDRGDVWYDTPIAYGGSIVGRPTEHRPTLTLYAKTPEGEIALVRWPTTIGGWKPERTRPREVMLSYKNSPPGKRIWRDLWAAPVWVPPDTAPKRELVRARYDKTWALRTELFGPGYASAYGVVLFVHHQPFLKMGASELGDEGIRTHGSVSYDSIEKGTSHGCHRLYNHLAVRLASFTLAHRKHVRYGPDKWGFGRSFKWQDRMLTMTFPSRGERYRFDPPVPVEVLPGRIMGSANAPLPNRPLPGALAKQFAQDFVE